MNQESSVNISIPKLPETLNGLCEIALNLWWTWNPRGKNLFKQLNPYLWKESGHNPIAMLKKISPEALEAAGKNASFLREYSYVYALFKDYINDKNIYSKEELSPIAYFCAEYGLHHTVPIYSGGLGFLAGDILKESSDMGLPMVGIGFMYPEGYVRQIIGADGWQNGTTEPIEQDVAPIERVLDEKGNHFTIQVPFIDPPVYASIWKVNVGRVTLYLLDTDIEQNDPWDRQISSRLYTSDINQRLRQQIVLGIGGYRVLEKLGIEYSILHLNEGYPAFALFERVRSCIEDENLTLEEAISRVKKTSIFTTHTPLQAGTDVHSFDMISKNFQDYWQRLGMDKETFMSFGLNPDDPNAGFNMTVFGLKMCDNRNAVSKKHSEVAQKIWKNILPETSKEQPAIDYVTNGVHLSTWAGDEFIEILEHTLGNRWMMMQDDPDLWGYIEDIDDEVIWNISYGGKVRMVNFIRERVRRKWSDEGIDPVVAMAEGVMLDPDVLTIGFARRMTEYKRPALILHDLDRLEKIVNNYARPVQIVFSGKAHPSDITGKKILQHIFKTAQDPRFRGRIAFIEDYSENVAKHLVRGVDVWLNNPLIPMEACGTSGMKAALNGVLHLSVMDGWWPEGSNGKNGWTFGSEPSDDAEDAASLYDTIENEIVPLYYDVRENGISHGWIDKMKESMMSISPRFSARRMMKEYMRKFYVPISKELLTEEKSESTAASSAVRPEPLQ
ncbi:MAG: alpha-glucan family phosphorylase [Helicobacteraceae bacterium]|jgi:starch phosphorylase|nr:alpha-glucan family phosphorylase [Helicobacteraceae bacterium]